MALRFQENDEVDRAAKEERHTGGLIFLLVLLAVTTGVTDWIRGQSLASYKEEIGFYVVCVFVSWLLTPFYYQFRIRAKEIDGKVTAIEHSVAASSVDITALREQLQAIQYKLDGLSSTVSNEFQRGDNRR